MFDMSALEPFADPRPPQIFDRFQRAMAGRLGRCTFIITEDWDGQVEASLRRVDGGWPTSGNVRALLRKLDVQEPLEATKSRTTIHLVIRKARVQ